MSIRILRAKLDSDRTALIEMFRQYLSADYDDKKFDWLYSRSPHGEGRAWIACDQSSGKMAGAAAAFPRKVYLDGKEKTGFVLGDFCVAEGYRSLGPSLQLQRACIAAMEQDLFEFLYDFPSEEMLAIYKRLGIPRSGSLARWAKPLRAEAKAQGILRSKTLAKAAAFVVDPLLRRRGWKGGKDTCEIAVHQGLCGDEFTNLQQRFQKRPGIQTCRNSQYLNWRFLERPNVTNEILTVRREGTLIGYVVYTRAVKDASILDLDCVHESSVVARLLAAAVERLRLLGAPTVSLHSAEAHPWNQVFEHAGFRRRETAPIVVSTRSGASISPHDFQSNWRAMSGERES